ncbi:hypothetical protein ACIA58_15710 [Kribbella sp. NPDC051586]|uniref:hypothetical protein n=1 Tax=Kribbella sp. NPDC051586 TaxID=3364118 RepID=UPI0037A421D7
MAGCITADVLQPASEQTNRRLLARWDWGGGLLALRGWGEWGVRARAAASGGVECSRCRGGGGGVLVLSGWWGE